MTGADAFLRAVRDQPDDEMNYLVYADWLDDHGQAARAELVRVQGALHGLRWQADEYPEPHREALREREKALLTAHADEWLAELPDLPGVGWDFHRGLVARVVFANAYVFRDRVAEVFGRAPVQHVAFKALRGLQHVAGSPLLRWVRQLDLSGKLLRGGIRLLATTPEVEGLTWLDLSGNNLSSADVRLLFRSSFLANLRSLHLGQSRSNKNFLAVEGVEALAEAAHFRQLRELFLRGNAIGPGGGRALAGAPQLSGLRVLELTGCNIGNAGGQALAGSPHLARLEGLHLRGNQLSAPAAEALGAARFPALHTLCLRGNFIGSAGARALADNPHFARLAVLDLSANVIGDEGAAALARSPHLAGLELLDLASAGIGDAGACALAESPGLTRLRWLNVYNNLYTDRGRAALRARFAGALHE
jgi:uncharacterized protein (TIGR02996 family)